MSPMRAMSGVPSVWTNKCQCVTDAPRVGYKPRIRGGTGLGSSPKARGLKKLTVNKPSTCTFEKSAGFFTGSTGLTECTGLARSLKKHDTLKLFQLLYKNLSLKNPVQLEAQNSQTRSSSTRNELQRRSHLEIYL